MNFITCKPDESVAQPDSDQGKRLPEIRARRFDRSLGLTSDTENLLSRQEQKRLQSIATVIEYGGGRTIYSPGESSRFVYLVDEGLVRVARYTENGHRQILGFKRSGDFFGLSDCGQHISSVETVCHTRVYRFPWGEFLEIVSSEPRLQLTLLAKFACDCSVAEQRVMVLGQQNIRQRLASYLLDIVQHPESVAVTNSQVKLPIDRFDLAAYLGTSIESASRALTKLEEEGLVRRIGARTVEILAIEGLEAVQRGRRRNDRPSRRRARA